MYNKINKFLYLFIYSRKWDGWQERYPACKKQKFVIFVIFYVLHFCILYLYHLCDSSVELMYSCEKSDAVMYQRQIDRVSHSGAVMSHSLSADGTARSCQATATTTHCCSVQHGALTCVDCNIVVLAATAWVESCSCQWGRVVAVVEC